MSKLTDDELLTIAANFKYDEPPVLDSLGFMQWPVMFGRAVARATEAKMLDEGRATNFIGEASEIRDELTLREGDVIRNLLSGRTYIVSQNTGGKVIAVRTLTVDNPAEWALMRGGVR